MTRAWPGVPGVATAGATLVLSLAAPTEAAGPAVPLGSEFQVNTYTTSDQHRVSIAAETDGDFVVVWRDFGAGNAQSQRYDSGGNPIGSEFQVNTWTTGDQDVPSVALDGQGDFVVVWTCDCPRPSDTDSGSVQGQRYASAGNPVGTEFQVNTYTTGYQGSPAVAAQANGDFVVVWDSDFRRSIRGQRYASDGMARGVEFQVNTYTTPPQSHPWVAVAGNGDFVVVWASNGSLGNDTDGSSIQGQRYASDGTPRGGQFQVNSYTTGSQGQAIGTAPSVATDAEGNFVVVWTSDGSFGNDADGSSVQGQRYASDGSTVGGEFQVNSYTTGNQTAAYQGRASVAVEPDGDFVVVWYSNGSYGSDTDGNSIQGQRYDSAGNPFGTEFQVNTYTTGSQREPAVAVQADDEFVVAWESNGSFGTDPSGRSVQVRRYGPPPKVPSLSAPGAATVALMMVVAAALALRWRSVSGRPRGR